MSSQACSSFLTPLQLLRATGYCKLHKSSEPVLLRIHNAYRKFIFFCTTLYVVQECIYSYKVRHDMDLLARVMFLLLCHITALAKQLVFYLKADVIEQMFDNFKDPLFNQSDAFAQSLLRVTATSASKLATAFSFSAVLTCTLWVVFPIIDHYQGRYVEFFFWMGNMDPNRPLIFEIFLIYTFSQTSLCAVGNTCMDSFMATILYQVQTQLRILRYNLEFFSDKCLEMKNLHPNRSYENILHRNFTPLLEHYKKICKATADLQEVFHIPIFLQFTIGGWVLCMAAYKIVDLRFLSVEFASMVLFIFCILVELFLYCFFGNEVSYESQLLTNSIYGMNWLDTPVSFRKSLILVLERAKKPLNPAAGRVIPLSLLTFVTILKSSYTFYAVLNQMKD